MRLTKGRVFWTWFILGIAYLFIIAFAMTSPLISMGITELFSTLDQLTQGLATPLLLAFILPGLAITFWYFFGVIRISRSKTSGIHLAASTMHEVMLKSEAEKRARAKFRELTASPDPHVFIWAPTDKRVDGKIKHEVTT